MNAHYLGLVGVTNTIFFISFILKSCFYKSAHLYNISCENKQKSHRQFITTIIRIGFS
jgi:hypothetical protein